MSIDQQVLEFDLGTVDDPERQDHDFVPAMLEIVRAFGVSVEQCRIMLENAYPIGNDEEAARLVNKDPQLTEENDGGNSDSDDAAAEDAMTLAFAMLGKAPLQVLNEKAQAGAFNQPTVGYIQEIPSGPLNARRWRAVITIDGVRYESPEPVKKLMDAKHVAARMVLKALKLTIQ